MERGSKAMKIQLIITHIIFIETIMTISCNHDSPSEINSKSEKNSVNPIIQSTMKETELTSLDKFKKLLVEKKYEEALSLIDAADDEKAKLLYTSDANDTMQFAFETIRFQGASVAYIYIYLMLDRPQNALEKYEEMISTLSNDQIDSIRHMIFIKRILLLARLNKFDDYIDECNKLINHTNPNIADYLYGYVFGAFGYIIKQDYDTAEKYLSTAETKFRSVVPPPDPAYSEDNENEYNLFKQNLRVCRYYLTYLRNEYYLKPNIIVSEVTNNPDEEVEMEVYLDFKIISKETGHALTVAEMNNLLDEDDKRRQEELNKPPVDPFLKQLELE
jgi:tetratricopeptide (TPR) repeat protein